MSFHDTLKNVKKILSISKVLVVGIAISFITIPSAFAGNSKTVQRGAQVTTVVLGWTIMGGSATCKGTTDYPNSADGIKSGWITGTHPLSINNLGGGQGDTSSIAGWGTQLNNPGTFIFTCGASDFSTLTVNDCLSGTVWSGTTCISAPDLTADIATPSVATPGIVNTLSAVIRNVGPSSTNGAFSNFFQVATAPNGGGNITDLSAVAMGTLGSGGSSATTKTSLFLGGPGTYSIRVCADKTSSAGGGVIIESNEGNNCGDPWTTITVACSGADKWDTINHVCADPRVTGSAIVGDYYPPGYLTLTCSNSPDTLTYDVIRQYTGLSIIGGPQTYSSSIPPISLTAGGDYSIQCIHGSVVSLPHTVTYNSIPPAPTVRLNISPKTITKDQKTVVSWDTKFPTNICTLTAAIVCPNNNCGPDQLAASTTLNALISTAVTDANDPAGGNRSVNTAITSPAPGHKSTDSPVVTVDYKALGKLTLPIKYTTDLTYQCGTVKETQRIRVTKSGEQ
jgi:hypothetical protein